MNICICGGGNLGHVISAYIAAKKGYDVSILTNHPNKWGRSIHLILPDGKELIGTLAGISNKPEDVLRNADLVIISLPGQYIQQELEKIKPFLKRNTVVGTVVSNTGFFFQAHTIMPDQPVFGFQRVPFISRIGEYGHKANLLGFKKKLHLCIENYEDKDSLKNELESLLDTPIDILNNYLEVSLSNSNPLLHSARLYTMWKNWKEGIVYPSQSLFYEEWTDEASEIYINMDNEFQALLKSLPVSEGSIPSVLKYYESTDAKSLTEKIRSIKAFQGIKSPMIEVQGGWIPDLNSRYFVEDFNFGAFFIKQIANENKISIPTIETVYNWYVNLRKMHNH